MPEYETRVLYTAQPDLQKEVDAAVAKCRNADRSYGLVHVRIGNYVTERVFTEPEFSKGKADLIVCLLKQQIDAAIAAAKEK